MWASLCVLLQGRGHWHNTWESDARLEYIALLHKSLFKKKWNQSTALKHRVAKLSGKHVEDDGQSMPSPLLSIQSHACAPLPYRCTTHERFL